MDWFDVAIIGGGHAGAEAALASARMGRPTVLITLDPAKIGALSCNPAVGGLAKGHLAKEVDALGGVLARAADRAGIQFRRLNTRKGPAVRGSRVQVDRTHFGRAVRRAIRNRPNLTVVTGEAIDLVVDQGRIQGVVLADGSRIKSRTAVLTTGTFLNGRVHIGGINFAAGRLGDPPAVGLTAALVRLGLEAGRLKTGTPARLDKKTIDFDKLEIQPGDRNPRPLSILTDRLSLPQVPCHLSRTTEATLNIIKNSLDRSPLYSGIITGIGARYCPSIEDKVVKFPDKPSHHVFLEPEGLDSNEIYPNGISTSLPLDVQEAVVRSIPGLEKAVIVRPGYGIEYDYINPNQLGSDLGVPHIEGLYLAGQINGTSGYEEAAAQGLLAGSNAARLIMDQEPIILSRDQAYLGVMVDDLTTVGTDEPYRMFTSRAEYRLLLREDNAAHRLTPLGRELGLVGEDQWRRFNRLVQAEDRAEAELNRIKLKPGPETDAALEAAGTSPLKESTKLLDLLKRPQLTWPLIRDILPAGDWPADLPDEACEAVEVAIKYAGYVAKQRAEAVKFKEMEQRVLPADLDYTGLAGLSRELVEKLNRVKPRSLGQASRIPGITPAALVLLSFKTRAATL